MSRTQRRRHDRRELGETIRSETERFLSGGTPFWHYHHICERKFIDRMDSDIPSTAEIARVIAAHFHRDAGPGERNAPSWFRRETNAVNRAKGKAALRRAVAHGDDDVLPIVRRFANWEWF